jgi:hypothetical protein
VFKLIRRFFQVKVLRDGTTQKLFPSQTRRWIFESSCTYRGTNFRRDWDSCYLLRICITFRQPACICWNPFWQGFAHYTWWTSERSLVCVAAFCGDILFTAAINKVFIKRRQLLFGRRDGSATRRYCFATARTWSRSVIKHSVEISNLYRYDKSQPHHE